MIRKNSQCIDCFCVLPTGEEVSTPEPGVQDERDGPNGGEEVQALCLQDGGEEPGSHPQVGGEITRIHQQLPGAFWTRWSLGMFPLTLVYKAVN